MPEVLQRLLAETSVVPAVNQIELHPYFQQKALQALHREHGILTQAWSPMGGITSYDAGERVSFDDPVLQQIAREHGKSAAQVMLRWHLQTAAQRMAQQYGVLHGLPVQPWQCAGQPQANRAAKGVGLGAKTVGTATKKFAFCV